MKNYPWKSTTIRKKWCFLLEDDKPYYKKWWLDFQGYERRISHGCCGPEAAKVRRLAMKPENLAPEV